MTERKKECLRQMTIVSKIYGLLQILTSQTSGILESFGEMDQKDPFICRSDVFENMRYIANDILTTLDEYLQSVKTEN